MRPPPETNHIPVSCAPPTRPLALRRGPPKRRGGRRRHPCTPPHPTPPPHPPPNPSTLPLGRPLLLDTHSGGSAAWPGSTTMQRIVSCYWPSSSPHACPTPHPESAFTPLHRISGLIAPLLTPSLPCARARARAPLPPRRFHNTPNVRPTRPQFWLSLAHCTPPLPAPHCAPPS